MYAALAAAALANKKNKGGPPGTYTINIHDLILLCFFVNGHFDVALT